MRLSLSNGIFASRRLEEGIAAVRRLGFENLEFNMKCVRENDDDSVYPAKDSIVVNKLNCLTLHAATLHVEKKEEIARAKYYGSVSLEFAHKLGAQVMVIHSNVSRRLPEDLRRSFLQEVFSEMRLQARSLGVRLALENLSYSSNGFGKNVAELEEVLGIIDADHTVGITFDCCHAEATGQTLEVLEKYKNRIFNIHISNRAHKPFDKGTPSLKLLLKKLQEYGFDGPLTLELNRKCTTEEVLRTRKVIEKTMVEVQNGAGCGI